jgi:predicted dienelactone hydrolase
MRPLEALIVLVDSILVIVPLSRGLREWRRWRVILTGLAAVLVLAHLVWEKYRWQMIPFYALTGWLVLRATVRTRERGRGRTIAGAALQGVLVVLGVALLVLLPVPRMPEPTGPYAIGTVTYHWIDDSRTETYGGADGSSPRELMAQIWYPAEPAPGARPVPWLEDGLVVSRAMAEWVSLPGFLVDQITLTRSHSYRDAPLAASENGYPLVVSIHGWGGYRNINQDQLEALASHGFVVVSADHAYGALISVFPDGRTALNDATALRGDGSDEDLERAREALVGVWADDVAYLLRQMEGLNAADPDGRFTGRIDLERIGVFGHSTGGGAAVWFCAEDQRCRAVLGMDAWVEPVPGAILERGLTQPLMFMNSETWNQPQNAERQRRLYREASGPAYWMVTQGTWHYDFVMVPSLSPIAHLLKMKGPLPGERVVEIHNSYLVAFFQRHLRGTDETLLAATSPMYPEVQFEIRE